MSDLTETELYWLRELANKPTPGFLVEFGWVAPWAGSLRHDLGSWAFSKINAPTQKYLLVLGFWFNFMPRSEFCNTIRLVLGL